MKHALTFAGLLIATLVSISCVAHAASTPVAAHEPAPAPKSVFVIDPATGKDPFFPKSKRFLPAAPQTNDAVQVYHQPLFPEELHCQGFSGTIEKRLAIINNRTVEKGEIWEVTLKSGQRVQVRCIEVKEKSVVLEVNGITKELTLRAGL